MDSKIIEARKKLKRLMKEGRRLDKLKMNINLHECANKSYLKREVI